MRAEKKATIPAPSNRVFQANVTVRALYCLGLLSFIPRLQEIGFWLHRWPGLSNYIINALVVVSCLAILLRIYQVLRHPALLDCVSNSRVAYVRKFGLLGMAVGAASAFWMFDAQLIVFFVGYSGSLFIAKVFLLATIIAKPLARTGWIGCLLFELARRLGPTDTSATTENNPSKRSQGTIIVATLMAISIAGNAIYFGVIHLQRNKYEARLEAQKHIFEKQIQEQSNADIPFANVKLEVVENTNYDPDRPIEADAWSDLVWDAKRSSECNKFLKPDAYPSPYSRFTNVTAHFEASY